MTASGLRPVLTQQARARLPFVVIKSHETASLVVSSAAAAAAA